MDYSRARKWLKAHPLASYGLAIGLSLLSLAARLTLARDIDGVPFLTFFPAILVSTWLAGRGPGLTCVALSGYLAWAYVFPPGEHLGYPWSSRAMGLGVYLAVALPMTWLLDGFLNAYRRLKDAEIANAELLKQLEIRVAARTSQLTEANRLLRDEIAFRKEAEDQVAQYQRLEAVGQLVGGISHDFNNLLGVVIGNLDLAKRRIARGDPNFVPHVDAAFESARRGASLTQRLLAFARKQPLNPEVTDVNELLTRMLDLLKSTIGERITVVADLEAGIGHARIDASQLENAVLNLALNSKDAMRDGGTLTLATANAEIGDHASGAPDQEPGRYVVVTVSDNGHGMGEEVLSRAFEPFFTTKGVGHGTGLGLSQIHGFLKQSGGHATIESSVGKGTSIRMYLPRHLEQTAPVRTDVPFEKTLLTPRQGCKILVVEDQDEVRAMTVEVLKELGYAVIEAEDGAAALARLSDDPDIRLLFTDVIMPGLLGTELAERATAARPDLKVVFTSGFPGDTSPGTQDNSLPADRFLPKPFTPEDLSRVLDRALHDA